MGDIAHTSLLNPNNCLRPNRRLRCNSSSTAEQILKEDRKERRLQPDKPIHVPGDSIMSSHQPIIPRNFGGFINWGFLLLSIGGIRLFLENLNRYGVRVNPMAWLKTLYRFINASDNFQMAWLVVYINVPIILALLIEKMFAVGVIGCGKKGVVVFNFLQVSNILHTLLLPMIAMNFYSYGKTLSFGEIMPIYVIHVAYVVLAMKLISYVHVNYWARNRSSKRRKTYKPTTCGVIRKTPNKNECCSELTRPKESDVLQLNNNDVNEDTPYSVESNKDNEITSVDGDSPAVIVIDSKSKFLIMMKKIVIDSLVIKLPTAVLHIIRHKVDYIMKHLQQLLITWTFLPVRLIDVAKFSLQYLVRLLSCCKIGRCICGIVQKSVISALHFLHSTHDNEDNETVTNSNLICRSLDEQQEYFANDDDSTKVNHTSSIASDSSLPSTWNERDIDMGLESSITAGTSTANTDDDYRGEPSYGENDVRKLSAQYKTLLWLTSLMLKDESSRCNNKSIKEKAGINIEATRETISEKKQFQLITSKMITMTRFKNRCRRLSLCETEIRAFTEHGEQMYNATKESKHVNNHPLLPKYTKKLVKYPSNLTLYDIYYFMLAPTLCYELNFPRSDRIRKSLLIRRALEVIIGINLLMALAQQWIIPSVVNSLIPFSEMNIGLAAERILKLAIPNHLIWLTSAYLIFHSYLNTLAEILQFADRQFYKDWWNSGNIGIFWRTWNIPVHRWFVRHVYKPILGIKGCTRTIASTVVFLVSAILHEYVVSVPLQMFKAYAFLGMLLQLPLMRLSTITQEQLGNRGGNIIVWMSLIIGQPLALLMYYHDFVVEHYGHQDIQQFADLDTLDAI